MPVEVNALLEWNIFLYCPVIVSNDKNPTPVVEKKVWKPDVELQLIFKFMANAQNVAKAESPGPISFYPSRPYVIQQSCTLEIDYGEHKEDKTSLKWVR